MTDEENFFRNEAEKAECAPAVSENSGCAEPDGMPEKSGSMPLPEETGDSNRLSSGEQAMRNAPVIESMQGTSGLSSGVAGDKTTERGSRFIGVCLRKSGQVFFLPDEGQNVRIGSKVVVELEHGSALGEVASIVYGIAPSHISKDGTRNIGRITGLATAEDIALNTENNILRAEASAFCKSCIRQRRLDMKLVDVEVLHDRSKIIFYFTAPARIDFRELVKDLVRNYRTRIELRQIGVRHETQMIGGIGNCGMVCCCHKYLRKFAPVTIKMAKEQNLFLNPAKLSGMCGRLLCCLSFEQGNYEEFNRRCPKIGKKYITDTGTLKILRANMFSQSILVLSEAGEETELTLEGWDALHPRRAEPPAPEQQRAAALRDMAEDQLRKGRVREYDRKSASEEGRAPIPDLAKHNGETHDAEDSPSKQEGELRHRSWKRRKPPESS